MHGSILRQTLLLGLLAALSGCGEAEERPALLVDTPISVSDVHQWFPVAAEHRITYFEDGEPEILDVAERRVGNVITQRTVYINNTAVPGENYFQTTVLYHPGADILYGTEEARALFEDSVGFDSDGLDERLEREFPKARIEPGAALPTNVYGYYSYAFARYGADTVCTYVWQVIGDRSRILPRDYIGVLLEMRLCQADPAGDQVGDPVLARLALFEDVRFTDKTGILPKQQLFEGFEPPSVFVYTPERDANGLPPTRALGPRIGGGAPKPGFVSIGVP